MIDLRLGDCLEVMREIPDASVDAVIADIPYGTTACSWDTVIPFAPMWEQLKRLAKPRAAIVLFGSQPFTSALVMSNPQMFRYEWVWQKPRITGYLDANRRPMKSHENICIFSKNGHVYNPQKEKGAIHKSGAKPKHKGQARVYGSHERILTESDMWYPRSIIRFSGDSETTVTRKHRPNKLERHPTQKPVALMEYLIRTYTNENDTVLDFTMGSGTTMVACVNTKRNGIGIELREDYFAIAQRRIREAQAQLTLAL